MQFVPMMLAGRWTKRGYTDPVDVWYVTFAVDGAGAGAHKPHAGSVNGAPNMVVCYPQTEDLTQVAGDICDDDVTHITILFESKTVPRPWLPSERGRTSVAMGYPRDHGKDRNQSEVKVTNGTDATHVLVMGTENASQDGANLNLPFNSTQGEPVHQSVKVDSLTFWGLLVDNNVNI